MPVQHFVLTRFCLRYWQRSQTFDGIRLPRDYDPLGIDNLLLRSLTISAISYPSIANQTFQDFSWIIMVEPDLDPVWLDKLSLIADRHGNIHIHPLDEDSEIGFTDWLKPYVHEDTRYLAMTLLDDDDALCPDYMRVLHENIEQDQTADTDPVRLYGTLKAIQWDMDFTGAAPCGKFAPEWHRRRHDAVACGLTLVARYPEFRISASALRHGLMDAYFKPSHAVHGNEPNVLWVQQQFQAGFQRLGLDPGLLFGIQLERLDEWVDPVLITNHGRNLQQNRITEFKPGSRPVVPGQLFGSCEVNWAMIMTRSTLFERQLRTPIIRKLARRLRHLYRRAVDGLF